MMVLTHTEYDADKATCRSDLGGSCGASRGEAAKMQAGCVHHKNCPHITITR
jgi:hypothetical protein